jgi:hypothetical protein
VPRVAYGSTRCDYFFAPIRCRPPSLGTPLVDVTLFL